MTYTKLKITGSKASEELELLVDMGSVYTWIPEDILQKIGISPKGERKFRTIEGRDIIREVGEAGLEINGERSTSIVVFAVKGDASLLGAYSLEGLGLELDPTNKQLKKVEAFITY